jgi:CheY-like chemotaxis protein
MIAKSNANNRKLANVFISYARVDVEFAIKLRDALIACRFEAFLDMHSILPGEPWQDRLAELINVCDTVLFALSPQSIASKVCEWEVGEAERLNKRVIPVVFRDPNEDTMPSRLRRLNYVFLRDETEWSTNFEKLVSGIQINIEWIREHTRLGEAARRWQESKRSAARLLRDGEIIDANDWLRRRTPESPEPTQLIKDFISASEEAEKVREAIVKRKAKEREHLENAKNLAETKVQTATQAVALRRFARAIAGEQGIGDSQVLALLGALVQRPEDLPQGLPLDEAMYRALVLKQVARDRNLRQERFGVSSKKITCPLLHQQVLLLQYEVGFANEKVAKILGINEGEIALLTEQAWKTMTELFPSLNILIVDDEEDVANVIARMLKYYGHVVRCAFTVDDLVAIKRSFAPDVVICDGTLGLGMGAACHAIVLSIEVPVVVVTGYALSQLSGETNEPAFLLRKPCRREELMVMVNQAMLFAKERVRNSW